MQVINLMQLINCMHGMKRKKKKQMKKEKKNDEEVNNIKHVPKINIRSASMAELNKQKYKE